jgi:hypothetical protein
MAAASLAAMRGLFHGSAQKARRLRLRHFDVFQTAPHHMTEMGDFDYAAPAEVFASRGRGSAPRPVAYRRFDTGAAAVQYVIEELPRDVQFGTVIEANEHRFGAAEIRKLYDSSSYPLERNAL